MKKTALYMRYSAGPDQTENSIDGQRRVCENYAQGKDLKIIEEYVDRALTGKNDNRPEFQRLIADASKGLFQAVLVYRTDRFARNKYDSVIYKSKLRKLGIEIHYAAEPMPDGPEGILLESMMEGLAEYYSAELSQKIKRGMRENASKGLVTGGGLVLGYKIGPAKTFEIDETESHIVQTIFSMFLNGKTYADICVYLNDMGIKTSRGNPYNKNSIPRILKNEKYIGLYKCGEIRIENAIPQIITKEQFYMVQSELDRRKKIKRPKSPTAHYMLSGKLYCGNCGEKMIGVSGTSGKGKIYYYYYCPKSRKKKGCDKKHVNRDWLESLVVEETVKYIGEPANVEYIVKELTKAQLANLSSDETVNFLESKIAENKKSLSNTLKAIESGVVTKALPERIRELEIEAVKLEEELEYTKASHVVLDSLDLEFLISRYAQPNVDKEKVIKGFISSVELHDDRLYIFVNLKGPDGKLIKLMREGLNRTGVVFDHGDNASTNVSQIYLGYTETIRVYLSDYKYRHRT